MTEAWSPLARGKVLSDPVVIGIAERLRRTPSQVVLRWHVQRGDVVFPKTMSATRMRENLDIFGFELEADDLEVITALDQGEAGRIGPHPDTFDWIPADPHGRYRAARDGRLTQAREGDEGDDRHRRR